MKKVYCLYRGNKEGIEAQKLACYIYAKLQGWTITKEFSEENNVSEDEKDSLILIHDDALKEGFDILLVYDYDNTNYIYAIFNKPTCRKWYFHLILANVIYDKRDFKKERRKALNNMN